MTVIKRIASRIFNIPETDHRAIGAVQKLFFFSELSQGSCFFQPRGAHIYNNLIQYLRDLYREHKYEEVITPNIYDCRLWETSGHWEHYKDNMIRFKLGENDFSLKPMNCPGHCLMFKQLNRVTSDDLPIRWADFGVLHRNELSGALSGLARGRRFQQDDAHIFCTPEQVESEVKNCLELANKVYDDFGFTFDVALSLRPKEYMGDDKLWDLAEASLRGALERANLKWTEQKFEGAFYGPKIDMIVKDCLQRSNQCATIQLDFQLPARFDLCYSDVVDKSSQHPVIVHRAILGSIERFIAMVAENSSGRWPFWLSPLQAQVIPINHNLNDYASRVKDRLVGEGFMVDCELDKSLRLNRKIREAVVSKYNFILLVGEREAEADSVSARFDVDGNHHQVRLSVDRLISLFKEFKVKKVKQAERELLNALSS